MFSTEYYQEIRKGFDRQMQFVEERIHILEKEKDMGQGLAQVTGRLLLEKKEEIQDTFSRCTEEEAQALTFLYSAMPLSDLQDYPASLFLAYAKHGVYLWNHGPFAGRVPEKIFANYVLHYRVNNEDIADTRGFFHDRLKEAVEIGSHRSMYDTAIDVNYWCAREATYRSTDIRTQNPRTMYGTAMGRCGEESTFGVTSLRSIGIPARQIYAPLWTHCDDNHAWVELWCDGEWQFLGACEPEEKMNRGWFIGPASRAVMLHSRWFGKEEPDETQVGPKGMARVLNHMDRYAGTVELALRAEDEAGRPVPHAKVVLQVLNYGSLGPVAVVYTGSEGEDCGRAGLVTGLGDLYVTVSTNDLYGEKKVSLKEIKPGEKAECRIVLKDKPECSDEWENLEFQAPEPGHMHDGDLTVEQQETGARRLSQAAEYRQKKAESFYDVREAERVLGRFPEDDRVCVEAILQKSHSNINEIIRFIEWNANHLLPLRWQEHSGDHWKVEVLKTLSEKDYWDIKAETLMDCCISALPYAGKVPEEIFYRFVACPRVSRELLRPCRLALEKYVDEDTKNQIRKNPGILPELAEKWILSMPEQEYEDLITTPLGCLAGGVGSRYSREVFCVNLYRSLGIPSRLNRLDGGLEYYLDGQFRRAEGGEESCRLTLCTDDSLKLNEREHYSLERFEEDGFCRLGLWDCQMEGNQAELQLKPGMYRILTTNRRRNGDQLAKMLTFRLQRGESREILLSIRDIPVEDLLSRTKTEDFSVSTLEGHASLLSGFTGEGKALFLWLEVTREPTEHILNELFDLKEEFSALKVPLYAVLRDKEDLQNATLRRTMEALPKLTPLLDDFGANYEKLAETVGQQAGKLPLAVVMEGREQCIYSDAGYNVGLADMLLRVLE